MGIRTKTSLSILTAVAISIGLFYQVANQTLNTRFTALEKDQAQSRLIFTLRLLDHGRNGLNLLVKDWSVWNDVYAFINKPNPDFIESNLVDATFSDANLTYIGFYPLEGQAVWEGFYDPSTQKMGRPLPELTRTLNKWVARFRKGDAEQEIEPGFFVSEGALHFMAANPILKSDESGPSRGWLIMVQHLEQNFFHELFKDPETRITVCTHALPAQTDIIHFQFTDDRKHYTCTETLSNIMGDASIEINLSGPSRISQAGKRLLALTGAGISLTGLLLALITYLLIQRTLLKRILHLRHQVAPVATPGAPVENVRIQGRDELSELAADINLVFTRIFEEECLNHSILTALNVGILMIDAQSGRIQETNVCMEEMMGIKREELVGQPAGDLFHPVETSRETHHTPHQEKGTLRGNTSRHVIRITTTTRYHDTPIRIETFTDVQALEAAVEDAKRSESHYRTLFKNSATPSVIFDKRGTIVKLNREFLRYAGTQDPKDLLGRNWISFLNNEDEAKLRTCLRHKKSAAISFDDNMEIKFHDLLGAIHTAKIHVARLPGTQKRVVSMLDMTRQKKAEELLRHQAFYDSLTGLANRRLFMETLDHAMDMARRRKAGITLLLIDLDGFKHVNDTLGHQSGDRLLTMVANRFTNTLRKSDTTARLGGDEFTILAEENYNARELVLLIQRIQEAFKPAFKIGTTQLHITLSIGVARFPDDARDPETLIRNADLAMYRAKKTGNTYSFFTHSLDKEARVRFEMEQDLRQAMEKTQFLMYLQPRIGIHGHRLLGMEGLIRWVHPIKGLCSPSEFIPCAESNGLIVPMDLWIMETGCRLITEWNQGRGTPLMISLNISAWHFRNHLLPERVANVLKETGCHPQWLELEVTETALMENLAAAAPHLKKLRQMGVSIALDDFGTGYSSLNYLRSMPLDTLKIDRSFISTLNEEDEKGLFLIKTIINLGNEFGIQVVAEGVETPEQMRLLQAMGCPVAQGFLWAPPVPPADFPHHLTVYPPSKT
ncbi:EAL domain-containing protein [Desulfoluna sp.]|uniref:EAL domain-containing protein n=1 Tax=Desulfoluna sp. TaxID=2045199 RepID=UPI00261DAD2D|nr:EAL domain-containing protein [Desulfoluna sp.]